MPVRAGGQRDARYRAVADAAQLARPTQTLAGQDQVYGGPGNVPDYDWPNPRLPDLLTRRRSQSDLSPLSPLRNPSSSYRALGNPVAAQMNTTFTNDLSADGFTWAQGAPSIEDKYGNPICLVQRDNDSAHGGAKQHNFVYSNTAGASWADAGIAETAIDRGACAYDAGHDVIHVAYNGQDVSDGIFYRRYLISYTAGTKQISGIARLDSVSVILDNQQSGESVQYQHPSAIFCPELPLDGVSGNVLVFVYGIYNANGANPGYEIRAVCRVLSYDSGDGTAANWRAVHSAAGVPSGDTTAIGNTPVTGTYTAVIANTTGTGVPYCSCFRKTWETGSLPGSIIIVFGRAQASSVLQWAQCRLTWTSNQWTKSTASLIEAVTTAGTDAGYSLKLQLCSGLSPDQTNDAFYVTYPVWKSDALGDTLRVRRIDLATLTGTAIDLYSAGGSNTDGSRDMFVVGDAHWDEISGALVVAYGDLPRHDVYVATLTKDLALIGAAPLAIPSAFTTAPCDIPTIHPSRVNGKTAIVFRDFNAGARTNPPTYTPPYLGWWLTLDWVDPRPQEASVYWHPSAQRLRRGTLDQFVDLQTTLLGVVPSSPVQPIDWALPPPGRPRRQVDVLLGLVETTLAGQDALYGAPGEVRGFDWPNPLLRRVQQPEIPPSLLGTLLFVVPPVPLLPYDWPNPLRAAIWARPINRDEALSLVLGTLLGQDVLYGGPGQVIPYAWPVPPGPRRPVQPEQPLGLLGTLLFVVPPVPATPIDWPNPLRREPTRDNRIHLATGYPLQLRGQDAVYGPPGMVPAYDWTGVPKGRPPGVVTNRDHLVNLVIRTLLGQDRFYAGFGQVPTHEAERQSITPRGDLNRLAARWRAVLSQEDVTVRTSQGVVIVSLGSVVLAIISPSIGVVLTSPGVDLELGG